MEEMSDFMNILKGNSNMSIEDQKRLGQAPAGKMDPQHEEFMKLLLSLIEKKEIDPVKPDTCLKEEIYSKLSEEAQGKVDIALVNIVDLLGQIVDFRLSKETPDESPQLQSMISYLWQMKDRVEGQHGDVFKF